MKKLLTLVTLLVCAAALAFSQNVSSSVLTTIVDPSGAPIPGAECTLINQATGTAATVKSDNQGACVFTIVQGGTYDLGVKATGFKTLNTKNIFVTSGETRTLGQLKLEVGAHHRERPGNRRGLADQPGQRREGGHHLHAQLQNMAIKGRDMFAYMMTIPGVVDNMSQARETTSPDSLRGTFINGSRENAKNYAVDGITNLDTGSNNTLQFEPNMDSIAEVKVMTSNFQAEFGRNGGGVITVITQRRQPRLSRERDTTPTGMRSLNANIFWNNRRHRQGSVPLPHHWLHRGRPGFHSQKVQQQPGQAVLLLQPGVHRAAQGLWNEARNHADRPERNGDFSQSLTGSGTLIKVIDPTNLASSSQATSFPKAVSARWASLC